MTREEKDAAIRERDAALGVPTHPQNVWRRVGGARQMKYAPERGYDVIFSINSDDDGSTYVEMCKLNDSGVGISEVTSVRLTAEASNELARYLLRGSTSGSNLSESPSVERDPNGSTAPDGT